MVKGQLKRRLTNVEKLTIEFMSVIIIPAGSGADSMTRALEALSSVTRLRDAMREAMATTQRVLAVVKAAPDNWLGTDDEAIAGHILSLIEKRRAATRPMAEGRVPRLEGS